MYNALIIIVGSTLQVHHRTVTFLQRSPYTNYKPWKIVVLESLLRMLILPIFLHAIRHGQSQDQGLTSCWKCNWFEVWVFKFLSLSSDLKSLTAALLLQVLIYLLCKKNCQVNVFVNALTWQP